jgi:hypothetical protein
MFVSLLYYFNAAPSVLEKVYQVLWDPLLTVSWKTLAIWGFLAKSTTARKHYEEMLREAGESGLLESASFESGKRSVDLCGMLNFPKKMRRTWLLSWFAYLPMQVS